MCGGEGSTNGDLDYIAEYHTSGVVQFDAIYRSWAETAVTLYGPPYSACFPSACDPSYTAPSDWLYPGTTAPDVYYLTDSQGFPIHNQPVTAGYYYKGGVTTTTTTASEGGYSVAFGLGVTLPGVGPVGLNAQAGWSQTSSTSYSQDLQWEVEVPSGGQPTCFDVFGQGGSVSQDTADIVGVWSWAATYYSNNQTWGCP
jgi:hypothetical protein